ncbi:hypothetical protein [Luteibacter sp. 621]|uniref:hypothetical protein n=1 Tax=Luteibacter sp. 621 TaxID=3373916 RepID=UPI003D2490E1
MGCPLYKRRAERFFRLAPASPAWRGYPDGVTQLLGKPVLLEDSCNRPAQVGRSMPALAAQPAQLLADLVFRHGICFHRILVLISGASYWRPEPRPTSQAAGID